MPIGRPFGLLVLLCVLAVHTAWAEPLIFVADNEFRPYSFLYQGQPHGADVDIFMAVAQRAGLEVEIRLVEGEEMGELLRSGQAHGALGLVPTPDCCRYLDFMVGNAMHATTVSVFVKRADQFPFSGTPDLSGKHLAMANNVTAPEEFLKAARQGLFELEYMDNESDCLGALLEGRVDAFVGQTEVTTYLLNRGGLTSTVVPLSTPLQASRDAYMALSKAADLPDRDELLRRLDDALASVIADGTYRKIMQGYIFK